MHEEEEDCESIYDKVGDKRKTNTIDTMDNNMTYMMAKKNGVDYVQRRKGLLKTTTSTLL